MNADSPATYSQQKMGYSYPVLKPQEIQSCLHDMGFEITLDELTDPAHHKEKLREMFTLLVRSPIVYCLLLFV